MASGSSPGQVHPIQVLTMLGDRLRQALERFPETQINQAEVVGILDVIDNVRAQLINRERRSVWLEFMRPTDISALVRFLRQFYITARRYQSGDATAEQLHVQVATLLEQAQWCADGIGAESDLEVLMGHLDQAPAENIRRQLRIAECMAEALDGVTQRTQDELDVVRVAQPRGTDDVRERQARQLRILSEGLSEILTRANAAAEALRLYHGFLVLDLSEQAQSGFSRELTQRQAVFAMHHRHRALLKRAVLVLGEALDVELPPLPPELREG